MENKCPKKKNILLDRLRNFSDKWTGKNNSNNKKINV